MDQRRLDRSRYRGASERWIDRWLAACSELAELERTNPMTDAVIDEIDGRMIRIGDQWLADFASCNYLGFDLDREIIAAVPEYLEKWGTHPSWSRMLGSPVLYEQIEQRLAQLLGSRDVLVLPTITLIHLAVIPVLASDGTIFVDNRAHKTIYDGCQFAAARGASIKRFRFEDSDDLEQLLRKDRSESRLICMDGVNSMTGNAPTCPTSLGSRVSTTRRSMSTTPTGSAYLASARETSRARTARAGTVWCAISARRTTGSCSYPGFRSRTRHSPRSSPVRPS